MRCLVLTATAFAVLALSGPALAVTDTIGPPSVIPAVGVTLHLRITRTTQESTGRRAVVSDIILRRKSGSALTLDGLIAGHRLDLTVLTLGSDGLLQIPKSDKTASQDTALADVVSGLNHASEALGGPNGISNDGWSALITLNDVRAANASVVVPVGVSSVRPGDMDLHGVGQLLVSPGGGATATASPAPGGSGRRRGGFGGGFPGGGGSGYPRGGGSREGGGERPSGDATGSRLPLSVAVNVDGRIRHGAVDEIAIVETRSITLDQYAYANVSGWTVDVAH